MCRMPGIGHAKSDRFPGSEHLPLHRYAEGGPNTLAIIAHAWASGVEKGVAPICMPS